MRHAYWRTPAGGQEKGQENRYAPIVLLSEYGKQASVNADGSVSWRGLSLLRHEQVIVGSIVIRDSDREELNQQDCAAIVHTAVLSCIKKKGGGKPLDASVVLAECNKEASRFCRLASHPYVFITSLTLKSFPAKRIRIGSCLISPLQNRSRYPYPKALQDEMSREASGSTSSNYQFVRVRITGRSIHEAVDRALETLATLCGLWNLFAAVPWSIFTSRPRRKPIGVANIGSIHTLHELDRKPVGDLYWYEHELVGIQEPFAPKKGWATIEKNRRWAMRRLRSLPFGHSLRKLIARYADALGNANSDIAFLKMWGILESITDTTGARYDDTIDRAIWLFQDRDNAREFLQYLRTRRNQYVHAGRSDEDREDIAQLIMRFIDPHLLTLLRNEFKVESLEEYADYLKLPSSIASLKQRHRLLGRGIRMRKLWKKSQ